MLSEHFTNSHKRYLSLRYTDGKQRGHWHDVWSKALANMPAITNRPCGMGGFVGQQSALGYCLGYGSGKKGSRPHHAVYSGWYNGSKPDGKRAELLEQLAGPNGSELALELLTKMGRAKVYNIWPHIQESIGCFMLAREEP